MGVQNLWMLLAPVGRQIEIETLASNVLAVDASIWLTQFIKAMRDDEGNMIKNAHLIGTFHRVAKLLFYRIRPVFVFDGSTPEIKKRTVARRRRRQEHQAANLKQTAQRILLNRLKLYREELKKNGGKPLENSAVAPNFLLPNEPSRNSALEHKEEDVIMVDDSEEEKTDDQPAAETSSAESSARPRRSNADETKSEELDPSDDDEMTADDIVLDTSRLSRVDLDAVFALPGPLQKDMIARIQRDHRQEAREKFIPLAGNPEAYSRTQISSFLKTSQLNRQIMKARKKNAQLEMEKAAADAALDAGELHGNGQRIASSSDRFYIYEKSQRPNAEEEGEDENRNREIENDEAAHWKLSGSIEAPVDAEDDEDIFDRIHGSKRRRRYREEGAVVVKKSLADFSVDSVQEFAAEMSRDQRRKIAVQEARRKFLEKNPEQKKQEAIEPSKLAADSSKEDDPSSQSTNSITITLKREDLNSLDEKAESLFPSSIFEVVKPSDGGQAAAQVEADEEDDGIDWEDVPKAESLPAAQDGSPALTLQASSQTIEKKIEDGEVTSAKAVSVPVHRDVVTVDGDSDEDVQWEDASEGITNATEVTKVNHVHAESDHDAEEDQIGSVVDLEPDAKDVYSSLQAEIDDERAEEDLAALRAEALQSAIATASNLTQWAAGAVRRALAQHTRAADLTLTVPDAGAKALTPIMQARESDREVIDLSRGEAEDATAQTEDLVVRKTPGIESEAQDKNDRLLQQAIEESIVNAKQEAAKSTSTRYLQYATSPEPEPTVDVGAIVDEQKELKKLRNRQMRDTEGVNDEMVEDVMELLNLFGVPYLVCPMEAEAQCAALEQLGLVDGIITDDSDIFPFGGKKVYKNIFHNQKFVEAFFANDVENELGFSQDEMIALAILLGSDYTDGVRGIGIVNASEVVAAYPGLVGLKDFKDWVQTFDVAEEARRRLEKKKTQAEIDAMTPRERFEYAHASARRKWELGDEFPNSRVIQAYKNPQVDRSDARFSWELPNLAGLREYCTKTFGWDQSKTDTVLLPLMEQIASFANERQRQTRIDQFFTKYDDNVKYAKIQSKRLRSAVEDKTGASRSTTGGKNGAKLPAQTSKAKVQAGKTKFTKTKKTTSTLGL